MASLNAYAHSLRSDHPLAKAYETGVPFFVPHLSKVKTSVMCQVTSPTLLFQFETPSKEPTLEPLPYRKQGNPAFDTAANRLKRHQLRSDPSIQHAIARFWDTFASIRRGGDAIARHEYVTVFIKLYKALVAPSDFAIGEARAIVEKDWANDAIEDDTMSKRRFCHALFEVVDIWTLRIDATEYVAFLHKLFERVTITIYDHVTMQWMTAFAELEAIRSLEDPAAFEDENQPRSDDETGDTRGGSLPELHHHSKAATTLESLSSRNHERLPALNPASQRHSEGWSPSPSALEQSPRSENSATASLATDVSAPSTARLATAACSDLGPPHVVLHLPNIYLNPDLTGVHEAERAARRRLRRNAKLVQHVRRMLT